MSENQWLAAPKIDYSPDGVEFRICGEYLKRRVNFMGVAGEIVGRDRHGELYLIDTMGDFIHFAIMTRRVLFMALGERF